MLSSLLILLLLLLQQLHFPHRCIMDLRKFPLDSQVGSPHQKLLTITGFDYFNSKIKVFHKHNFRFKRIYPSQRHFTPPLKRITRIFPIFFGKYEFYSPNFQNTRFISKCCHFRKIRVIFSKFWKIRGIISKLSKIWGI